MKIDNASLTFANLDKTIGAYRACRANGLDVTLSCSRLNFHDEADKELAESILPSYGFQPIYE